MSTRATTPRRTRLLTRWLGPVTAVAVVVTGLVGSPSAPPASAAASADDPSFVRALYADLLGRDADESGLAGWTAALGSGSSRSDVALSLQLSPEGLGQVVDRQYRAALGRAAEPAGVTAWSRYLSGGAPVSELQVSVYSSPEALLHLGGGDARAWVGGLYTNLLGRDASEVERAHWADVARTTGRDGVVRGVVRSPESAQRRLSGYYQQLLGRPADASAAGWVPWLLRDADYAVVAMLSSSSEYRGRSAARFPVTTPPPTPEPTPEPTPTPPTTEAVPTAATTGVPAGWTPARSVTGDYRVSTPGAVVQDLRITNGSLVIAAQNVTVRRVEVRGGSIDNLPGSTCGNGLVIEDSSIVRAPGQVTRGDEPAITAGGYTARRVKIDGLPEGFRVSGRSYGCGPVTIEGSYARVVSPDQCGDWHGDALQGYDGSRLTLRNSVLELVETRGCGGTAPFFYPSGQGNTSVDVDGLVVRGGGFPFRLGMPGTVRNLRIVDGGWGYGPINVLCSAVSVWDARIVRVDQNLVPVSVVRQQPCNTNAGG